MFRKGQYKGCICGRIHRSYACDKHIDSLITSLYKDIYDKHDNYWRKMLEIDEKVLKDYVDNNEHF
jgi:hypothetical protein